MDNKKLTKVLTITLVSLLVFFILIRIVAKNKNKEVELPNMNTQLSYNPEKEKEKGKLAQYEEEKNKKTNPIQETYLPNFKELGANEKKEELTKTIPTNSNPTSNNGKEYNFSKENSISTNNNHSGLSYESQFLKNNSNPPISNIEEKTPTFQTKPSTFGTIKTQIGTNSVINSNYYKGEIYGDQKILDQGAVIIRLIEPIQMEQFSLSKNSLLYGQATYKGNRVWVTINRVKTNMGEFPVSFSILDNDGIEGIYYKAPIDQSSEKSQDETEIPIGGTYGKMINKVGQTISNNTKDLIRNSRSLHLEDGYSIFITTQKK